MTNGSRVRRLFFKNQTSHQIKCSKLVSQRNSVDECVEDGESLAMPNEFYKKQCHV